MPISSATRRWLRLGALPIILALVAGLSLQGPVAANAAAGSDTAAKALTSPYLRVKVRTIESGYDPLTLGIGLKAGIRLRSDVHIKRWRIEFSQPVRQVGVGKVSVITGYGDPPYQTKVVWLQTGNIDMYVRAVTRSGVVLKKHKTLTVYAVMGISIGG